MEDLLYHRSQKVHYESIPFGVSSNNSDFLIGSIVPNDVEKRHFPPRNCRQPDFKPSLKMVDHIDRCPDDVIIPKRRAQLHTLKFTASDRYRDRRHLQESDLPCVINPKDRELNWTRKKIVFDDDQRPVSCFQSSEHQIETVINRKQRVPTIDNQRNFVGLASQGDKAYKFAETSPGFFKDGALIAGSSIKPRKVKTNVPQNADDKELKKSLKSLTATEKRLINIAESDKQQVEMLTNSHFKRGQEMPCWEEKTGMWLCRPEEED